jgi:TM2 domain-containing membrane protein YozV
MSANWAQWWWWRFNGWARVAASFGGGACYLAIAMLWPAWPWWNRMFLSMGISTLLWIVVAVATTPERNELLVAFYRRARPLGSWGAIARLAGEPQPATKLRFPVAAGLSLAASGAIAVMAYITGISQFYIGRYNTGLLLFSILALTGALFLFAFPRYVDSLLSIEEKDQAAATHTALATFGLHRIFSVVCFGASAVLAFQTAFLRGGATSLTMCLIAIGCGLLLLHYGRSKGIKQSGV